MLSVRGTLYWVLFFLFTATARTASAQPVLQDTAQLRLWIKADAGITLNGSNVTRWGDQTINGFSFQQDTLARQPQLIPAALNGYPVVRFDSAQTQYMIAGDILDSIIAGAGKAFTVISVVKAGGPNQTWLAKNSDFNQNEREFILFGNATKLLNFFYSAPASSPRVIVGSNDTIRYGQFELLSASYNAAVSNSVGRVQMHIASKPQTEVLVSSAGTFPFNITDGSAPLTVGAYTNATGASGKYCLTGDIAEILIYKGVLPDSTRQKAELYLRQKYAPGVVNLGPDTTVNYGFCPITLNAGSGYYSYAWSTGSTASTAPISQSGSYSVTVTDVFGFKSSDTIQVTYPGTINYTGNTSICSGSTRVWNTGLPSGTGYSYSWSNGDTTSSLAIALPGIYQVTVTGNGCPFVSTPVAFTLDLYPDVVSLGNDTALCAGSFIGLTDGAAQTVSYLWNTGAVTPTISIPSTSTYSVTATNAAGCVGVDNILVTIAGVAPVAAFGIADFCFSEPTQFTDSSTHPNGIASWKWDFSTGDTSILQNPAYTFTTLGSKTITLVVTTGSGCKATLSKTIQVINPPVAGFTHSLVYQNAPTTLVNTTVSDSVTNYNWNWITGTSTTKNPTVSFTNAGNIPVTLSVIDVNGCADTITKNITVIAPPPAAGLCLWIRADTGLTVNGSAVSQWLDQTGNSFAFTQATVAKQPQRIPNALNGLPVVRFNGSTTYMTAGDILDSVFVGTSPTPKGSFSVVAAIKTNVANRAFIAKHSDLSENERQFLMYVNAGSKLDMAYYTPTGTPRANIEGHDDISFGEYRLLSTTYDGNNNSALDRVQMFVTSQPQTEVLASSAGTLPFNLPDGNAPLTLGGYANTQGTTSSFNLNGDIAEILIYNGALTNSVRLQVEQYLREKYAPPAVKLGPDVTVSYGVCPTQLNAGTWYHSYQWSTGETASSISVNKTGTYSVTVMDVLGYISSDTINVNLPYTGTNISDTTICLGDAVQIVQQIANPGLYTYEWQNGSTLQSFTTVLPGAYYASITDTNGCQIQSDTVHIAVDSFKLTNLLPDDTAVCSGNEISIYTGSYTLQSALWSGGASGPKNIVTTQGNYSITAVDTIGCQAKDTVFIEVKSTKPILDFTAPPVCFGNSTQFTQIFQQIGQDGIKQRTWEFGTGDTSNVQNPTYNYFAPGDYNVTLSIVTDSGCTAETTKIVTSSIPPIPGFTYPAVICAGVPTQLTDQSAYLFGDIITGWVWTINGDSLTDKNPIYEFSGQGTYQVTLTAISQSGCSDSVTENVDVFPPLIASFSYTDVCLGDSTAFIDLTASLSVVDWQWTFGDNLSFIDIRQNPKHKYLLAGDYDVTLRVENAIGCIDYLTQSVSIVPRPTAKFGNLIACEDRNYTPLDSSIVSNDTIATWNWTISGTAYNGQAPTHTFATAGSYPVKLRVTTQNGCVDSTSKTVSVKPSPMAQFTLTPLYGAAPVEISFINQSAGATTYFWNFGDGDASTDAAPFHTYAADDTFNITFTATSAFGCEDTASRTFIVAPTDLDLAVEDITVTKKPQPDGSYLINVVADVRNMGTRLVTHAQFYITIGSGGVISEEWDTVLASGGQDRIVFTAEFVVSAENANSYVCVTAVSVNNGETETRTDNNSQCASTDQTIEIIGPSPNPMSSNASIGIIVPKQGVITIDIANIAGQYVLKGEQVNVPKGRSDWQLPADKMRSGEYFMRIYYNDDVIVKKFIVAKQ